MGTGEGSRMSAEEADCRSEEAGMPGAKHNGHISTGEGERARRIGAGRMRVRDDPAAHGGRQEGRA